MPNHVKNRLELIGSKEEIEAFVAKFSTFYPTTPNRSYDDNIIYKTKDKNYQVGWLNEKTGMFIRRNEEPVHGVPEGFEIDMEPEWTRFPDFEKVFPIPEIIKAVGEINGSVESAVKAKYSAPLSSTNALLSGLELMNRAKAKVREEDQAAFELACKAYEETGYVYWYDYQIAHWGTKWNAYSCEQLSDTVYSFETAWSSVPDIIVEMSKSFNGSINYKYADEDTGHNCGILKIAGGEILNEYRPVGGSNEAYELAFELRPHHADYYELVDGKYTSKEE